MLRKAILVFIGAIFMMNHAIAEGTANPHKARDQKMISCKNEADQKQLTGDERRSFIAECVKKTN